MTNQAVYTKKLTDLHGEEARTEIGAKLTPERLKGRPACR
jgi:hypothetical protein